MIGEFGVPELVGPVLLVADDPADAADENKPPPTAGGRPPGRPLGRPTSGPAPAEEDPEEEEVAPEGSGTVVVSVRCVVVVAVALPPVVWAVVVLVALVVPVPNTPPGAELTDPPATLPEPELAPDPAFG